MYVCMYVCVCVCPGGAALISRELNRMAVDVAALSETRLLEKGELEKGG